MARSRDNQRSKVYAWERAAVVRLGEAASLYEPDFKTLEECEEFMRPIWRKERGRVGLARQKAPELSRNLWGQRSAMAMDDHTIKLPKWARSRWVILHEMAHRLTPDDEAHGPRFVGVLIGLVARWAGYSADELMQLADEHGVKYSVRSIGAVPVRGLAWKVEQMVKREGPLPEMELAFLCDVTYLQARGAALSLIRAGRARWLRKKLHLKENACT